jgi:membrane associated rhomboid family serine protease
MMQSPFANLPSVTKNLLIINIICFLPFLVFNGGQTIGLYNSVSAHYFDSPLFKPWQPITYMFFHGGWMHIIFNMFALYSFGAILEYSMGAKRFVIFYFICGLGGVALQMVMQAYQVHTITGQFTLAATDLDASYLAYGPKAQDLYNIYHSSMVGASGAISGLLIAFALMYPNAELMLFFIPVPIKAKYVMPGYILLSLFLGVRPMEGDNVAHLAHLGGALLGFILVKLWRLQGPKDLMY